MWISNRTTTHTKGEINVESDLVFANYMNDLKADTPKEKEYSDEYNLCKFYGRRRITEWKAKNQNVAYGQMGNMGLSVYVNKEKDHIILTESYIESDIKVKKLKDMGMKKHGDNISLSVWRWEATDVNTRKSIR